MIESLRLLVRYYNVMRYMTQCVMTAIRAVRELLDSSILTPDIMLYFLLKQFSTNTFSENYSLGLQFSKPLLLLVVACCEVLAVVVITALGGKSRPAGGGRSSAAGG
jgi:hypothetical protein